MSHALKGPLPSLTYEDQLRWLGSEVEQVQGQLRNVLKAGLSGKLLTARLHALLSIAESVKVAHEHAREISNA